MRTLVQVQAELHKLVTELEMIIDAADTTTNARRLAYQLTTRLDNQINDTMVNIKHYVSI